MLNILQGTKAKKLTSISKLRINQIAGQWSLKWFGSHFGQISSCDITPGGVKFSKNTKIHDGLTYKALRRRFYQVIACRWCWKMNISNWTPVLKLKNGTLWLSHSFGSVLNLFPQTLLRRLIWNYEWNAFSISLKGCNFKVEFILPD